MRYNIFVFVKRHKQDDPRIVLIITIGSARVTGTLLAIVGFEQQKKVTILSADEVPLVYQERLNTERFSRSMFGAFIELVQQIEVGGLPQVRAVYGAKTQIDEIRCIFSAPWFVSQARIVHFKRTKPFLISEELITKLVSEEVELFQKTLAAKNSPYSLLSRNTRIIDSHVIRSTVNEYPVRTPVGKNGNALSLTLYISAVSGDVATRLSDICTRTFPSVPLSMSTSTLVLFLSTSTLLKTPSQYLIIEINGEITEVALIEHEVFTETISFPFGTSGVVRYVAKRMRIKPEDVSARLALLLEAKAERTSEGINAFEKNIYAAISEWQEGLYRALERMAQGRPVPQTAFVITDEKWELIFLTALRNKPFELFTFSDKPFTVLSLNAPLVRSRITLADKVRLYPLSMLASMNPDHGLTTPQGVLQ